MISLNFCHLTTHLSEVLQWHLKNFAFKIIKLLTELWILKINAWIKINDNSLGTRFADMACEEELHIPASCCHFYADLHVDSNIYEVFHKKLKSNEHFVHICTSFVIQQFLSCKWRLVCNCSVQNSKLTSIMTCNKKKKISNS